MSVKRKAKAYAVNCSGCGKEFMVGKRRKEPFCSPSCRTERVETTARLMRELGENMAVDVRTIAPGAAFPDGRLAEEPGGLFLSVTFTEAGWGMVAEAAAQLGRDPEDYVRELQRAAVANVHLALGMDRLPVAL